MAGQPVVVLNTHTIAADLLGDNIPRSPHVAAYSITDRRSNVYSDRPRFIMASEILTGGIFMVFASYGEVFVLLHFEFFVLFYSQESSLCQMA